MLDRMSDSIQGSSIENLHSREVDRQSPKGLIFIIKMNRKYVRNEVISDIRGSIICLHIVGKNLLKTLYITVTVFLIC